MLFLVFFFSGGSLLTTLGVFLNSLKMCCLHRRHLSGDVASWLDRAKENNGGHYTETHVENVKILAKLFPLYGLQLLYRVCITQAGHWGYLGYATRITSLLKCFFLQIPSGYYIQTMNSNLHLNDLLLPIGVMNVISILPLLLLAPLMELVSTCYFSMEKTPLVPSKVISKFSLHTSLHAPNDAHTSLNDFVSLTLLFLYPLFHSCNCSTAPSLITPPCPSSFCSYRPRVCHSVSTGGSFV